MMVGSSVLKALVYVFNFVLFVCGAVVLGLGIWSAVADDGLYELLGSIMLTGIYILIASGAIIMLITFLGCYGCAADSKPSIVVYCTITLIAALLKTVGCVILYVYYIESTVYLSDVYKTAYGMAGEDKVDMAWDKAQIQGQCCGLLNYRDWEDSSFYNNTGKYPPSCCIPDPEDIEQLLDETRCQLPETGFIYEEGCEYVLKTYYYAIGSTTIVIIILEECRRTGFECHPQPATVCCSMKTKPLHCQLVAVILIAAYYQHIP